VVGVLWFLSNERPRFFIVTEGWDPYAILTFLQSDQASLTPFLNLSFLLGVSGLVAGTIAVAVRQRQTYGRVRLDRSSLALTLLWTILLLSFFQVWRWSTIVSTPCSPSELCSREFGDRLVLGYLDGRDGARNWLLAYVMAASVGLIFLWSRMRAFAEGAQDLRRQERTDWSGGPSAILLR
jgi:hypothetical protein